MSVSQSLAFFDSELFRQVQLSAIFEDSKTFADARPKLPFDEIYQHYYKHRQTHDSGFDLAAFVANYFELPKRPDLKLEGDHGDIQAHIKQLWSLLKQPADKQDNSSLLPLAQPYIVPGGRFSEIYYWDSYFTALGLIRQGETELVVNMLDNFVDLQQTVGLIPNGNRSYYNSRSQPPILALLLELLLHHQDKKRPNPQDHNIQLIKRYLPALEAEYQFWMGGKDELNKNQIALHRVVQMPDGSVLNRYYDDNNGPRPESYREDVELAQQLIQSKRCAFYRHIRAACESGWDFSSRWLADEGDLTTIETTDIVPVDLNSLLFQLELTLAKAYLALGLDQQAAEMKTLAHNRQAAINRYLWCDKVRFYFDYHLIKQQRKQVYSLAASVPLFVQAANSTQAAGVAKQLQERFLQPGGLVTTLSQTGQQWDSPNGWAPLQWFSVVGLCHYQHNELALEVISAWLNTVEAFFNHHGKLMEKYDVCEVDNQAAGGEYQVQEGFGWTNGVTIAFYDLLKALES